MANAATLCQSWSVGLKRSVFSQGTSSGSNVVSIRKSGQPFGILTFDVYAMAICMTTGSSMSKMMGI